MAKGVEITFDAKYESVVKGALQAAAAMEKVEGGTKKLTRAIADAGKEQEKLTKSVEGGSYAHLSDMEKTEQAFRRHRAAVRSLGKDAEAAGGSAGLLAGGLTKAAGALSGFVAGTFSLAAIKAELEKLPEAANRAAEALRGKVAQMQPLVGMVLPGGRGLGDITKEAMAIRGATGVPLEMAGRLMQRAEAPGDAEAMAQLASLRVTANPEAMLEQLQEYRRAWGPAAGSANAILGRFMLAGRGRMAPEEIGEATVAASGAMARVGGTPDELLALTAALSPAYGFSGRKTVGGINAIAAELAKAGIKQGGIVSGLAQLQANPDAYAKAMVEPTFATAAQYIAQNRGEIDRWRGSILAETGQTLTARVREARGDQSIAAVRAAEIHEANIGAREVGALGVAGLSLQEGIDARNRELAMLQERQPGLPRGLGVGLRVLEAIPRATMEALARPSELGADYERRAEAVRGGNVDSALLDMLGRVAEGIAKLVTLQSGPAAQPLASPNGAANSSPTTAQP